MICKHDLLTVFINHFVNHAQNKVRVSVGGLTRFVNTAY